MAKDAQIHAEASRLQGLGYALVPCHRHTKRPRAGAGWNKPENLVTTKAGVETWFGKADSNLGAALSASGLCSIDIDEPAMAREVFAALGLDLEQVMDTGCRISGAPGRSRSMFRTPDGPALASVKYTVSVAVLRAKGFPTKPGAADTDRVTVFELRGGSANSQDVLPPSVHPEGLHRYTYMNRPLKARKDMPLAPAAVTEAWRNWDDTCRRMNEHLGIAVAAPVADVEAPQELAAESVPASGAPFDFSVLETAPEATIAHAAPPPRPLEQAGGFKEIARLFSEHHGHDFRELLEQHGYKWMGQNRWLAPGSTTGEPGVHLAKDARHVFSYHGDVLGGNYTDAGGTPHPVPRDYFDAWCLLEHGGDKVAAVRAAKVELAVALASRDFGDAPDGDHLEQLEAVLGQATVGDAPKKPFNVRPLRAYTPGELRDMPRAQWRIHQVIPRSGLGMIYGPSGVGKSFAVMDLAMAIARGAPWNGQRVEQAGVLYIAAEGGRTHAPAVGIAIFPPFEIKPSFELVKINAVSHS